MIQRLLPIAMSIVLLGTTGTLVGFALHAEKEVTYLGLDVDVDEIKGMFFVDAAGVRDAILAQDSIQGSWIESVSLQQELPQPTILRMNQLLKSLLQQLR